VGLAARLGLSNTPLLQALTRGRGLP
jgi:hypothetical protein